MGRSTEVKIFRVGYFPFMDNQHHSGKTLDCGTFQVVVEDKVNQTTMDSLDIMIFDLDDHLVDSIWHKWNYLRFPIQLPFKPPGQSWILQTDPQTRDSFYILQEPRFMAQFEHFQEIDLCSFLENKSEKWERFLTRKARNNRPNSALYFTGGRSHVEVEHQSLFYDNFTITAWIKIEKMSDTTRILDQAVAGQLNGFLFDVLLLSKDQESGVLRICTHFDCVTGFRLLQIGVWYHVAVQFRTETPNNLPEVSFWVNGILDRRLADKSRWRPTPLLYNSDAPLRIGHPGKGKGGFQGFLDKMEVWGAFLTPEQIVWTMFHQPSGQEPFLLASWDFDSTEKLIDISPHNNHATPFSVSAVPSYSKPFFLNPYI